MCGVCEFEHICHSVCVKIRGQPSSVHSLPASWDLETELRSSACGPALFTHCSVSPVLVAFLVENKNKEVWELER